ncbi:hypothetical protein HDU87_000376 [Geranomyces variabilis]|uniref:G-patch domain-containing protein n=1 Tax=Geranomyces variabilis TaxID=109894 RepID=A0AAD5TNW0_9FUNG|nr:hypothetical protein HDU87_000376 [Geranomyces variabilis]
MSYYNRVSRGAAAASASAPTQPAQDAQDDDDDDDITTDRLTMDSHLPESNVGYQLLLKMGWKRGTGLGATGDGRVDPVRIYVEEGGLGLGKREQLNTYLAETTANRRMLASEVIAAETEAERAEREARAQRSSTIKEEIKAVTAAFYCSDCNKQYSKVSEYETHLSSYDHNHVARFKDMKEATRRGLLPGVVPDKRKRREDKERAREEKEMRRLEQAAEAMGAGRGAASTQPPPPPHSASSSPPPPPPSAAGAAVSAPSSRGGWDAVEEGEPSGPPSKGGWDSIAIVDPCQSNIKSDNVETAPCQAPPSLPQNANAPPPKMSFGFGKKPVGGGMKFGFKKKE